MANFKSLFLVVSIIAQAIGAWAQFGAPMGGGMGG